MMCDKRTASARRLSDWAGARALSVAVFNALRLEAGSGVSNAGGGRSQPKVSTLTLAPAAITSSGPTSNKAFDRLSPKSACDS